MDARRTESNSDTSTESIVERGWGIVSPNTEALLFMLCGVIGTITEVAGYWPSMSLKDLFPDEEGDEEFQSDFKAAIYKISDGVDLARLYSVHIYLATYILLPYPLITEKQKVLLTPWLLCGALRSLLLNLLLTLGGVMLCASQDEFHYPCFQYSYFKGSEFCVSLFVWTSVHNFYYFLERKKSDQNFSRVLKTIHKVSLRSPSTPMYEDSPESSFLVSLGSFSEDEDTGQESTLVERAAMAWIAREIMEDDGEYVTDSQFSRYLALKATMELRHIVKEMAERRKEQRRNLPGVATMKERIRESLEIYRNVSEPQVPGRESFLSKLEAFDQSVTLSKRDPLRKIPPLVFDGKPFLEDDESVDLDVRSLFDSWKADSSSTPPTVAQQTLSERSVEVQTDPLPPRMNQLFDELEQRIKQTQEKSAVKNERKVGEESKD